MHHGIPVVMMENPMQFNPVEHGETGFVARNAHEFAYFALKLYHDRELAMNMGERARQVARAHYSNSLLVEKLSTINLLFS